MIEAKYTNEFKRLLGLFLDTGEEASRKVAVRCTLGGQAGKSFDLFFTFLSKFVEDPQKKSCFATRSHLFEALSEAAGSILRGDSDPITLCSGNGFQCRG